MVKLKKWRNKEAELTLEGANEIYSGVVRLTPNPMNSNSKRYCLRTESGENFYLRGKGRRTVSDGNGGLILKIYN